MGEIIFLAILCAVSASTFFTAINYEVLSFDTSGGPGLFPSIISALLFLVCAILLVQLVYKKFVKKEESKPFGFKDLFSGMRLTFLCLTVAYIIGFQYIGFMIPSLLYINVLVNVIIYAQEKTLGSKVAFTKRTFILSAVVVILYIAFTKGLGLALPF